MNISVFGLGYVGAVSARCLAHDGHLVIGVDPNRTKIDLLNEGRSPIIEREIGPMIEKAVSSGRLHATSDVQEAVSQTELCVICVGTPSQLNGNLDLTYVRRVCEEIGAALRERAGYFVVAVRSTMLPGTMRDVVIPFLERSSGKIAGQDFGVCIHPEFLREGTAVADFYQPPKIVIGEDGTRCGDLIMRLYENIQAPVVRTAIEVAEMVKYADNAWHAVKVGFANEIGALSKAVGIDGQKVMKIFCQDLKLNLSAHYLSPGFAFGGSCLPKDVRALSYRARSLDVKVPLLDAVLPSNEVHIERGLRLITFQGHKKIGVLGFSFKAGTDDLRESPVVGMIERLLGKGYELKIYDRNVDIAKLMGANRDYILNHIPHIARLMVGSVDEVLTHAETVVIGNRDRDFQPFLDRIRPGQVVVDLVGIGSSRSGEGSYHGIGW